MKRKPAPQKPRRRNNITATPHPGSKSHDKRTQGRNGRHATVKQSAPENEQHFHMIVDNAPVLVWVSDTGKLCTWFNKAWLDFVGRTLEQEVGNGWTGNVHPEDLDRCLTIYTTAFDAREPFEMTYRLRRHDGEYRWMIDHGIPFYDTDGQFAGYVGSCVDITERKLADQAMRAKEAQLWLITANTPVMLAQCNRDLICMFANRACAQMLQLELDKIIGQPITEVLGAEAFAIIRPHVEQVLKGRRVEFDADIPYPRAGLRSMHVVYTPDTDSLGNVTGWLASLTDITDRRAAENELQRERAFLRQVIDATPSMIFVKDRKGRFLLGNEALARSCGTTVKKIIGKTDADFRRTPEQIAHFQADDRTVMDGGMLLQIPEEEVTQADGRPRWFSTVKVPLFNADGTCDKILGVGTDITERREAQQNLERTKAELELRVAERTAELVAANEQLVAQMEERRRLENALLDVSEQEQRRLGEDLHDGLCQTLSGIVFMGRSLTKTLQELQLAAPAADAARLTELLHQSVESARNIARGLQPLVVDAGGLVSALHELTARNNSSSVTCCLHCAHSVPVTDNAMALHLYRIAQEAVVNALKHAGARNVQVRFNQRGSMLTLEIEDDGCGIPEVVHAGKGMGLPLMQYRADVIGADIVIKRQPQGGTKVSCSVRLPAATAHVSMTTPLPDSAS
ncbi:MAG: PAS domain-containing protein [Verrucomicrobiaceae bacterium]